MPYALQLSDAELARYRFMAENARTTEGELWDQAGIRPGARIADIGCGPGAVLALLAEIAGPDGEAVGVDADGSAVEAATALLEAKGTRNARVQQGSADATGLDPAAFDVVVMRHVLVHNGGHEQRIVDHLATLVRPGGSVYLVDGNGPGFGMDPEPPFAREVQERYIAFLRSRGDDPQTGLRLGRLLRTAGLTLEEFRGWVPMVPLPRGLRPPAWAAREAMRQAGFLDDDDIARWQAALEALDAREERPMIFPSFFGAIGRRLSTPSS
jgi:SAM-dependent methyltransferase